MDINDKNLIERYVYKTPEQIREDDLQTIREYRLIDDTFARSAFKGKPELAEFVLRIITRIADLEIEPSSYETQFDSQRLVRSRSLFFDLHGSDTAGRQYDVEMEKWDASPERSEVHMGAMIAEHLFEGGGFSDLCETYVIFMCEYDAVGNGRAVNQFSYRNDDLFLENEEIEKQITPNASLGGRTHILFVNGNYKDETSEIGKLVHDFKCSDPNDMYFSNLADRVRFVKGDQKEVEKMCKVLEDIRKDDQARYEMRMRVLHTRSLMESLGVTVEKAMELIQIPQNMQSDVATLVKSNIYS